MEIIKFLVTTVPNQQVPTSPETILSDYLHTKYNISTSINRLSDTQFHISIPNLFPNLFSSHLMIIESVPFFIYPANNNTSFNLV